MSVRPEPGISVSENALKALLSHQQANAVLQPKSNAQMTSETLDRTLSPAIVSNLPKGRDNINNNSRLQSKNKEILI